MLRHFASGAALNRFQAEELHDHVLPQTVASLERRHGLHFEREAESVPGYAGTVTRVVRYSLAANERERANLILSHGTTKSLP